MANSVSKINIVVGASTGQLTAGMNKAASDVRRSMGGIQSIAQSATYAVDDFFAGFATGGVAGGLRGASNNLTMIAAQLGSIKAQLVIIAALAVGQLIAKQFSKAKSGADSAREALELYREALGRESGMVGRNAEFRNDLKDIQGMRTVGEAFRRKQDGQFSIQNIALQRGENANRIEELRAELEKEKRFKRSAARNEGLNASETDAEIDARIKVIAEEIAEREKVGRQLKDQLEDQRRLNREVDKNLKLLQQRRQDNMDGATGAFSGAGARVLRRSMASAAIADIDQEIASLRDSMRPSLSMADVFRMLPGANAMGSSGAIGAINSAISGPQNARDAGPALLRGIDGTLKRIEDLEKKKKGLVEVIGI